MGALTFVVVWGILDCRMWHLVPWPGLELGPPALGTSESSPLDHQGSPCSTVACWWIVSSSSYPLPFSLSGIVIYQVSYRKRLSLPENYLIFKRTAFFVCACPIFLLFVSVMGILKLKILSYFRASIVKYSHFDMEWNFPNCMIFETQIGFTFTFQSF